MSAVIDHESIGKVFFPCIYTYHTASSIVVTTTDEGKIQVISTWSLNSLESEPAMAKIFAKDGESEVKLLPVAFTRFVYPVEKKSHSRDEHKPSHEFEIEGSIEGGRDEQMWNAGDPHGMKRTQGLPYYEIRPDFIYPCGDLF